MEGGPFGRLSCSVERVLIIACEFEALIEMVVTLGRSDEEGSAGAIGKSGTDDARPDFRFHRCELVEDDEVEAVAAEGVVVIGATEGEGTAVWQAEGEFGFVNLHTGERSDECLQALPGDSFGLPIAGRDIPSVAV